VPPWAAYFAPSAANTCVSDLSSRVQDDEPDDFDEDEEEEDGDRDEEDGEEDSDEDEEVWQVRSSRCARGLRLSSREWLTSGLRPH